MSDLDFQNISTVQSDKQPKPKTVTAAAQISVDTFLTVLSGTTAVATIVPPVTGTHMIAVVFGTTTAALTTSGNIVGITTAGDTTSPVLFIYNPLTSKYVRTIA